MSRRAWILWLMLALLPLRGWAASVAGLTQAAQAVRAEQVVAVVAAASSAMHTHCHDDGDAGAATSSHHAGCGATCDLCHGGFVLAHDAALPRLDLPASPPAIAPAQDTGRRLPGGLERPPRRDRA